MGFNNLIDLQADWDNETFPQDSDSNRRRERNWSSHQFTIGSGRLSRPEDVAGVIASLGRMSIIEEK